MRRWPSHGSYWNGSPFGLRLRAVGENPGAADAAGVSVQRMRYTAVLLSGKTLELLSIATTLAQSVQPAIVVLEDCDLVAEHRGGRTNAALFETLEAMDGLAADADITFLLQAT